MLTRRSRQLEKLITPCQRVGLDRMSREGVAMLERARRLQNGIVSRLAVTLEPEL